MSTATVLLCAESGYFERLTPLVIESLRKFGGSLADAPVLVVTPRLGPAITRQTLEHFERLGARYVKRNHRHAYGWYPYTNKALAVLMAEEFAQTEQVIWLDSDVLVVKDIANLLLAPGEDIAICAYDKNVGSSGPDDPHEAYWQALGQHYGIPPESLPWVTTSYGAERVRFRLHSGVYSFRRGRGLGEKFVRDMETMFRSRVAFSSRLPFPGDDVALAYSIVALGLHWRLFGIESNFEIGPRSGTYRRELLLAANVLHFHHALVRPGEAAWMVQELQHQLPAVAEWLQPKVPVDVRVGGVSAIFARRALAEWRKLQSRRHLARCTPMVHV